MKIKLFALPLLLLALCQGIVRAENEGQEDLDKATELKLTAQNLNDLSNVIKLCQSAMTAGLDEGNTSFAKSLLASALVQRAEAVCSEIFDSPAPPQRWPQLRQLALKDLEESLKNVDDQAEPYYLIGRLSSLPQGDRKRGIEALDKAVELTEKVPVSRAKSLVLRANLSEDADKRMADYDEAVKIAPHNAEVVRSRGLYLLTQNKYDLAIADLDAAIEIDPQHADTHEARGVALFLSKDYREAMKSFDKAIELNPKNSMAYTHRARIYAVEGDNEKALAELDKGLSVDPNSLNVLLLRARVYQQAGDNKKALADVDRALKIRPGLVQALQLHAVLAAGAGKFDAAINDLEQLKRAAPGNTELLMQLGMFYAADKKPQKAVDTFDQVIAEDGKNWIAYRGRADAYLSIGKQAEAIADYEAALKLQPGNSGILNNLAWILATSPEDKLRDGKRSIELAQQACKVTDFKQAHIVSTLAAAYAETGDFDKAVEWSKKAVDLGAEQLKGQLSKELQSYETKKPWREALPDPDAPMTEDDDDASPAGEDAPSDKFEREIGNPSSGDSDDEDAVTPDASADDSADPLLNRTSAKPAGDNVDENE